MDWGNFFTGSVFFFFFIVLFWPQRGFYFLWKRHCQLDLRETIEDALMHLHQEQQDGRLASTQSLAGTLGTSTKRVLKLVERMQTQGLLTANSEGLRLSREGDLWALQVVRAHRLFERYLADETAVPMAEIHEHAKRLQYCLSTQKLDKLEADMGYPTVDPHGAPIPTATGKLPARQSQSLVDWPAAKPAQIVYIQDEPKEAYAQIAAEGLRPGMVVRILEFTPTRMVIETDATEHVLAPVVAANISVREAPEASLAVPMRRLTDLNVGEKGCVLAINKVCRGLTRRRFLDLGITPGVSIEAVMQSAFNDPIAYRVRDTLIALRREQTDLILIAEESKNGEQP